MRRIIVTAALAAGTSVASVAAVPAAANGGVPPTSDTTATFTVQAGPLSIAAAGDLDLGRGPRGGPITGTMGTVTVTDQRAVAEAEWLVTVAATAFTTVGGTITADRLSYWSGPATATVGSGTFTPGQLTSAAAAALGGSPALVAFSHTGGAGGSAASWAPGLVVDVPADAAPGQYGGVVVHSLA